MKTSKLALFVSLVLASCFPIGLATAAPELVKPTALKMSTVPTEAGSIEVIFNIENVCSHGDMDLATLETLASGDSSSLLLTFESIGDSPTVFGSEVLTTVEVMKAARAEGYKFKFAAPQNPNGAYGFFICKSTGSSSGTCQDKELVDLFDLMQDYLVDPKKAGVEKLDSALQDKIGQLGKQAPSDKVYFFKPLISTGGQLQFVEGLLTESLLEKYNKLVSDSVPDKAHVDKIKRYEEMIGSRPLALTKEKSVVVSIPGHWAEKCGTIEAL